MRRPSRLTVAVLRSLRDPRWWVIPVSGAVAFVVLASVVTVALRPGSGTDLVALPEVGSLHYGPDTLAPVAALESAFVRDALGERFFRQIDDPAPTTPARPPRRGGGAGDADGGDGPTGERGRLPTPEDVTADPDLRIGMTVDRHTAARGDTLTYVITIANVGAGTARRVEIRSHVPEHTSLVASPECGGEPVTVREGSGPGGLPTACVDVPVAAGAPGEHGIVVGFSAFNGGRREQIVFRVAVNADAPRGYGIRNHSHVSADNAPSGTTDDVITTVQ